jgi:predicted Fe-Mo cluster-binding NifX family protein
MMMKIAVPVRDGLIDDHFGHCKEFSIFRVEGQSLIVEPSIPSAEGCGCKSDIALVLAHAGVTHLVAGNMGQGAVNVLAAQGIAVVRGASGEASVAAEAFVKGALKDSGKGCEGHGEAGHECSH